MDAKVVKFDFECTSCSKQKQNKIPVARIIDKLDSFFAINDMGNAKNLLEYWENEANAQGDLSGELSVVNELLGVYRKMADKGKGMPAVEKALGLLKLTGAENTLSGAVIIINAATALNAFDNPGRAAELYKRAEEIYEKEGISKDDLRYAALYNNYAATLVDIDELERAEELYKRAIEITGKSLDAAISYVNLAHLYGKKYGTDYEGIEACMGGAEEILCDEGIEHNSYYAFVSEKCAPSFDYFGYFFMAEELRKRAREIYERS